MFQNFVFQELFGKAATIEAKYIKQKRLGVRLFVKEWIPGVPEVRKCTTKKDEHYVIKRKVTGNPIEYTEEVGSRILREGVSPEETRSQI